MSIEPGPLPSPLLVEGLTERPGGEYTRESLVRVAEWAAAQEHAPGSQWALHLERVRAGIAALDADPQAHTAGASQSAAQLARGEASKAAPFKQGDLVQLRSGGVVMTFYRINPEGMCAGSAHLYYSAGGEIRQAFIAPGLICATGARLVGLTTADLDSIADTVTELRANVGNFDPGEAEDAICPLEKVLAAFGRSAS